MNLANWLWLAGRRSIPRILPLMRDERVPLKLKLGAAIAAVLIVSPLDPLADIPVLGLFDDAALLTLLATGFVALAERTAARVPRRVRPVDPQR